jgi:hypothetical protein
MAQSWEEEAQRKCVEQMLSIELTTEYIGIIARVFAFGKLDSGYLRLKQST